VPCTELGDDVFERESVLMEAAVAKEMTKMRKPAKREPKKPKTAPDRGKRYRCCICRKKSPTKTMQVPYYCAEHQHLANGDEYDEGDD
jgi:hypothetical protein